MSMTVRAGAGSDNRIYSWRGDVKWLARQQ
jgi:hypothetical protein